MSNIKWKDCEHVFHPFTSLNMPP